MTEISTKPQQKQNMGYKKEKFFFDHKIQFSFHLFQHIAKQDCEPHNLVIPNVKILLK